MTYSEVSVDLGFDDGSTIKLTEGPYNTSDPQLQMVKASIMMINNNSLSAYQPYIRNADNSPVKALGAIVNASITTISQTDYI